MNNRKKSSKTAKKLNSRSKSTGKKVNPDSNEDNINSKNESEIKNELNNNNENSKSKPTNSNEDGKSKPTLPKVRLDKTNKSYKFWVKESNKRNHYLRCIVCADDPDKDDDVLVQSCYGKHSHQNGKSHIEVETKYKKNHPNDFHESKNESEIKDKEVNINVKSNECNICMNNFNLDYFGCPKCFNTVCYNCANYILELNELFICLLCRYTI